jgi:hypothetical protein
VTSTFSGSTRASSVVISGAASTTRSKLSSTSSVGCVRLRASASASASAPWGPAAVRSPNPAAISGTTRAASVRPASATKHVPPGKSPRISSITRIARRVLPVPPGPVSVTSRTSSAESSARIASRSLSRPTNDVRVAGGAPKLAASRPPWGASSCSSRPASAVAISRVEA